MFLATFAGADGRALLGYVDPDSGMIVDLQGQHRALFGTSNLAFESMLALIDGGRRTLDLVLCTVGAGGVDDAVTHPLHAVRLLSPVPVPRQIRAYSGRTRSAGVAMRDPDGRGRRARAFWNHPEFYLANRFNVVGPDADVEWPNHASGQLESALKIGMFLAAGGKDIARERAQGHIFGYTIFNDFSTREDISRGAEPRSGCAPGKSFDTGNVIGPWIVTADDIPDIQALQATIRVNGEIWSRRSTAGLHDFADMIAFVSRDETLHAGEFFASEAIGSVSGTEIDRRLRPEDVVELEVSGIGVLRNRVVMRRRMTA
jgi:2-keto-4-pentenoate hydratase/2-oxohepta-3-ene-1,7-dioic acid hydratase in catechol pathway